MNIRWREEKESRLVNLSQLSGVFDSRLHGADDFSQHGPHDTSAFRNETLLHGREGCYPIGKERALAMKSRISTTELKSRTSHVEGLICWLETVFIQVLLTLTLWPLKLIYNRPMEPWWVWDTNRKLCNLDQRFC